MGKLFSGYPPDTTPTTDDKIATYDTATGLNKVVTISDLITLLFANAPTSNKIPSGVLQPYAGKTAPTDWLNCDGTAVSRTTFANLFSAISPSVGTFTVTIAAPGVFTLSAHGLQTGDAVYLTTSGALPTGLIANTLYYVVLVSSSTFSLATSRANAYAGTKITTSGTQSGTHTLFDCPWGLGDASTTFNVPDLRGRVLAGNDSIGGTLANRLTLAQTQGTYGNRGANGGEQGHTITTAELASHSHTTAPGSPITSAVIAAGGAITGTANSGNTGSSGSDTTHNNVQPTAITNYIIKS